MTAQDWSVLACEKAASPGIIYIYIYSHSIYIYISKVARKYVPIKNRLVEGALEKKLATKQCGHIYSYIYTLIYIYIYPYIYIYKTNF